MEKAQANCKKYDAFFYEAQKDFLDPRCVIEKDLEHSHSEQRYYCFGKVEIVPDFLPSPADLIIKEKTVKVTLSLTKESVDFFKEEVESCHTHYQTMIRKLLDQYAAHYMKE